MVRLGVIGFGIRVELLMKVFREIEPELEVVGIVDPDEVGVRKRLMNEDKNAVFYPNLSDMVSKAKPDGLMIGTRCNLHTLYAIEAAKYDIPLFLEKPVAVNMEQVIELEEAFQRSNCPAIVSFPLRVTPLCQITRRYIEEGKIGRPQHICATNYVTYGTVYWQVGYRNYDVTQGLFIQKATHDFDYMMYLMDSSIVRVGAMASKGNVFGGNMPENMRCSECPKARDCPESPQNRMRGGYNFPYEPYEDHLCVFSKACGTPETGMNEDSSSAIVEFANGTHGVYTQVFYSRRDAAQRGARISGYEGTLDFDWYRDELKYIRHLEPFSDSIKSAQNQSHSGGDHELARDFFDLIKGKGKIRSNIWMGIQSVYACLAAKESAETGAFVNVRQVSGK